MDTIEQLGRRAGAAALAAATQIAAPDDGLRRIMDDAATVVPSLASRRTRWSAQRWTVALAATAGLMAAVAAGVLAVRDDDTRHLGPNPTPSGPPVASSSPTAPTIETTTAPPTSTVQPPTTPLSTASPASVAPTQVAPESTAVGPPPATAPTSSTEPATPAPVFGSPSARTSELVALAGALGATRLAVETDDGLTVLHDGAAFDIATSSKWMWFDGDHVYAQIGPESEQFLVMRPDGSVACEGDGRIQRIRQRQDGTYIATVIRETDMGVSDSVLQPIPSFAIDCTTGDDQPIAPVAWSREAGGQSTLLVESRTFTVTSDAEGNADVVNEAGVSVNGQDYAGYHAFSADGSTVVYGDMSSAGSPHVSTRLRARDTTEGATLWSADLADLFNRIWVWGDRVAVGHLSSVESVDLSTVSVTVLDLASGALLAQVPVDQAVVYVG